MSDLSATTTTGAVKLKPWVHAGLLMVFVVLALTAYWLDSQGYNLGYISHEVGAASMSSLLYGIFIAACAYECAALAIQFAIARKGQA